MLQSMHKIATSLFAKILLGLLVLSFGLWGVGDIFRTSSGSSLLTVGPTKVSAEEYKSALIREQDSFRKMLGQNYSNELLTSMGIPEKVLNNLIQRRLIKSEVHDLGLEMPENRVMETLKNTPEFQGEDGRFDRTIFQNVLNNMGLLEGQYVAMLSEDTKNQALVRGVFEGAVVPKIAANLFYLFKEEKREADVLVLPANLITNIPAPTDKDLSAYYDEHKNNFKAPEYRNFSVLTIDHNQLTQNLTVSDEDALVEYQKRVDEFQEPEKRNVKQLLFAEKTEADAAYAALKGGLAFEEAAKKFPVTNNNLQVGNVTAAGIIPEAEKTVFSLPQNSFSTPIESSFGWHIFYVGHITPPATKAFADVKDSLIQELRNTKAEEETFAVSNNVQDTLAAGSSLEEAAKAADVATVAYGPLSATGTALDSSTKSDTPNHQGLLQHVFELGDGETSTLFENKDGSFYAVHVDKVIPARDLPLAEVKEKVTAEWNKAKRVSHLKDLADGIASQLKTQDIAAVAEKTGGKLLRGQTFARNTTNLQSGNQAVPAPLVPDLFEHRIGEATAAYPLQDGTYLIAKLTGIESVKAEGGDKAGGIATVREEMATDYKNDLFGQYLAYLKDKHGVSKVNQALYEKLLQ